MRLLQILAAALTLLTTLPAVAAEVSAVATYAITLGGTNIANVTVRLTDSGKRYSMNLDARISGLAQLVASGIAKADSAGSSNGAGLAAEKFGMTTRSGGQDFLVKVEFTGRQVTTFVVTPPIINTIGRVALERKHLNGVNDMMAAFVLKGGGLDRRLCERRLDVFTGIERFNVALRFEKADEATSKRTGYQGPLVLCTARYLPISGHYTTSEITTYLAESERILLWYAPLEVPGYFIPYRAVVGTSAGDLSVVLTKLQQ